MIRQHYQSYPVLHELTNTYDIYISSRRYIASLQQGIVQINDQALAALAGGGTSGQWKITDDIRDNPDIVSFSLHQLRDGMHSLGAEFNIAMGGVLIVFEMARPEYRAMVNKLTNSFKRDRKGEAESRLRDGLQAYRDGCKVIDKPDYFAQALRHFNAVIDRYREVPLVYFHIAHIYHYQGKMRNFRRALDNYHLALSSAEADPDYALLAAQAAFFAGWLTAAVFGDMQAAVDMTKKAIDYDPRLGEAHYHLAKIYGAFGDTREALAHLQEALVSFDRRYCYKIVLDSDFRILRNDLKKVLYDVAETDCTELETNLREQAERLTAVMRMHAGDKLDRARQLLETNEYERIAEAIGALYELKQKLLGQIKEQELSEEEKERRRAEEEERKADEEAQRRAAQEALMKEELKKRIEAEMKARIAAERKRERIKRFVKGMLGDAILVGCAFALGSFIFYGATTIGFVLVLLTCVLIIVWLCM
ncbi:MAG: hypothetical protein N3B18_04390 [Desulfobacterota bacterium]|nr:hypothetical protein [Thermodesulfobacteriota bacterium]